MLHGVAVRERGLPVALFALSRWAPENVDGIEGLGTSPKEAGPFRLGRLLACRAAAALCSVEASLYFPLR